MSTVRIPPVLRQHTNGSTEVDVTGSTVGEILNGLVAEYPDTKDQLFSEGGDLNRFVNVYLNDERARARRPRDGREGQRHRNDPARHGRRLLSLDSPSGPRRLRGNLNKASVWLGKHDVRLIGLRRKTRER